MKRQRRRSRVSAVPPKPLRRVRLTKANWALVVRARASMAAFDEMPEEWRRFCAEYPRTARGSSLAEVLESAGGNVRQAQNMLRYLLPVRSQD